MFIAMVIFDDNCNAQELNITCTVPQFQIKSIPIDLEADTMTKTLQPTWSDFSVCLVEDCEL